MLVDIFTNLVERLSQRKIYPFAPLGVNFTINLLWVVIRNFLKTRQDYRITQEITQDTSEGATGIFITVQVILYLFSFLVVFGVFLSLDFLFKVKDIEGLQYMWWLPSVVSIGLSEIAKVLEWVFKKGGTLLAEEKAEEETDLEKKIHHFSFYFWTTITALGAIWVYIFWGTDFNLVYEFLQIFNHLLL